MTLLSDVASRQRRPLPAAQGTTPRHAGWNYGSAPLFGAAGSGYLDQGHAFLYLPHGSALVTGGDVGPEESLLAFVAVLLAAGALVATVPMRTRADRAN